MRDRLCQVQKTVIIAVMHPTNAFRRVLVLALIIFSFSQQLVAIAAQPPSRTAQSVEVTAFDLIIAMNTLRTSYGLSALVEDPIIDAVAQSTAEIMAANQMSWHIGDVRGRLAAAGYGGGATVWATENFAVGSGYSIDEIMVIWADPSHMIPAVNPAYCNVGAGTAKSANGRTYYVLQAAYTSANSCGEYIPPEGNTTLPGGSTDLGRVGGVSQLVVPVKIAAPDADGKIIHEVQAGQSFWAIAVAYKITIKDIEFWNNLTRDSKLQIGQRLFIPSINTAGYATPTAVGMVQISTPDQDGKVVHSVQPYQTLITISQAYGTDVQTILNYNGLQLDWPLQIGQNLIIHLGSVTPSVTPRPLTAIQKLTPESDGKFYHIIQSGETLFWIAGYYEINLAELMAWNGLNQSSVLYPDQKLVLLVTPPATETSTPGPPTLTATITPLPPTSSPSPKPTQGAGSPTPTRTSSSGSLKSPVVGFLSVGLAVGALFIVGFFLARNSKSSQEIG
jgi:LysM repeat protein